MARLTFTLCAVALMCLLSISHGQNTTSTTTPATPVAGNVTASNTTAVTADADDAANTTATTAAADACPLTEDALLGVDFTDASTSCQDGNSTTFCSSCLCSIATSLVAGSPTFAALATSANATIDINALVETCAGTLGPALLSALTPDALTALAACDLNAAAATCTDQAAEPKPKVEATSGPVTPAPVQAPAAPRTSGVQGVVVSALLAAPVLLALWMA